MKKQMPQFQKSETFKPRNEKEKRMLKVFSSLKNESDAADFLRDLLTLAEMEEFANRLEIVRLLIKGYSYQKIAGLTKTSTTTVTRVAHWLLRGCGGYQRIIDILK